MNLIKQTTKWNCGLASLAMLLDTTIDDLILEIGHDGGEIIWPYLVAPKCYRGFNTQEFIDICYTRNIVLMEIEAIPHNLSENNSKPFRIWDSEREETRMESYMNGQSGIIIGQIESGARHSCAWDGERVYDPRGHIYYFDDQVGNVVQDSNLKEIYPIAVSEFLMAIPIH